MDQELKKLKQQYLLAPEKVNEISERIIHNNTLGITSVKDPHVIILGGQPGSGKGELITQAQDVLGINTVTCNADDYRDQHPLYQEIKSKHEKYYSDITADYSLVWNDRLRKHWSENDHRFFTSDILQLIKQMIWRGAGNDELKEIFEVFDLEKVEDLLAPELS